jgi:heme-degrading monooxygenase HmoA
MGIGIIDPTGKETMIVRTWRGRAAPEKKEANAAHFREAVLPELRRIPGFRGASLLRAGDEEIEFLVLTRWDSMAVIRAFAGDAVGRAVVDPGAVAALVDFDRTVTHYEVLEEMP